MGPLVKVHDWEGNFLTTAYITGLEYIHGEGGWFSSLILTTPSGQRLEGWKHQLSPFVKLLEWDWKDGDNTTG